MPIFSSCSLVKKVAWRTTAEVWVGARRSTFSPPNPSPTVAHRDCRSVRSALILESVFDPNLSQRYELETNFGGKRENLKHIWILHHPAKLGFTPIKVTRVQRKNSLSFQSSIVGSLVLLSIKNRHQGLITTGDPFLYFLCFCCIHFLYILCVTRFFILDSFIRVHCDYLYFIYLRY